MSVTAENTTTITTTEVEQVEQPCRITSLITKHSTTFWSYPIQRQRWTDEQIHPVVNWGDIFFDLFFVAAAYNVGNIIKENPDVNGVLYFLGCFFPIMHIWIDKMSYDARYYTKNDVIHQIYEVLALCALASCVLHVRTVDILSNTKDNVEMFAYSISILIASLLTIIRHIEVLLFVDGGPEAFYAARRDILVRGVSAIFFLVATIISGIDFYGNNNNDDDDHKDYYSDSNSYGSSSSYSKEEYNITTDEYGKDDNEYHRFLAAAEEYGILSSNNSDDNTNHIPIWLCLSGAMVINVLMIILFVIFLPNDGSHKSFTVPMNIDFCIHRYGEWTMLMLGESILSLLIVDVSDGEEYYITFFAGIVSVIMLQFLHFRSQPHHANEHALRTSKQGAAAFFMLMQIYSAALIIIGVSYKLLLYEYTYETKTYKSRFLPEELERFLAAASSGPKYDTEDRQQRIANFFSGSLAITFFCSDAMILTHKGLKNNIGRCQCEHTHKMKLFGLALILARAGLIAFVATLSQYETDPEQVALIGLAGVIAQLVLRGLSNIIFPDMNVNSNHHHSKDTAEHHHHGNSSGKNEEQDDDDEENKWPNMTRASVNKTTMDKGTVIGDDSNGR